MPKTNQEVITLFYQSFARHDAETMASLYHDDIEFTDPAFGTLKGEEARNMWRMLIERRKDSLVVAHSNVQASDDAGSAQWTADYRFGSTGRMVHNEITAKFEFHEGKIIRHVDNFSFWKWSRQALGLPGLLLGWTPYLKAKVRQQAKKGLKRFEESRKQR
jgi:ketosteroid isomerase-like protein